VPGAARGPAEESTFRRAYALASPDVPGLALGTWLHARAVQAGGRLVIAAGGKAVRGAKGKDAKAPHLVAALAHGTGAVPGQVAVDPKSNEIPAVRGLLKTFACLAWAVITIGALHTQSDTAQVITGRDADYVMTVKGNMPTLHRQLKKLPRARIPAVSPVSAGHGRRVRRTVTKKGKKTVEVVCLITSDRHADPATLAARVRGHREVGTTPATRNGHSSYFRLHKRLCRVPGVVGVMSLAPGMRFMAQDGVVAASVPRQLRTVRGRRTAGPSPARSIRNGGRDAHPGHQCQRGQRQRLRRGPRLRPRG
jgi:hypothetical protein